MGLPGIHGEGADDKDVDDVAHDGIDDSIDDHAQNLGLQGLAGTEYQC